MSAPAGRADARLVAYLGAGAVALVAAIVVGRPELAAVGAPLAALGLLGLGDRRPPGVRAAVTLAADRGLEGDEVTGTVTLDWDGVAEVDVVIDRHPGLFVLDPAPVLGWSLPATTGPVALGFRLAATSWGRHQLGAVHVRARRPGGLVEWEQVVATGPTVRILPRPLHLDALLRPTEPRAVAGAHLSRVRGPGTDLAELRPYVPGDRLRDLSWSASARTGEPWVIVRHPERTGTVVVALDAAHDSSTSGTEGLARSARAAWAVADVHLRAQDRVGLIASGRATAWLPPTGGRRARWMLLDELLAVGGATEDHRVHRPRSHIDLPGDALVVGVTTLRSPAFARDLVRHRRAGRTTVALVIDVNDLVPPPANIVDAAAYRLWRSEVDVERHRLARAGVATAVVAGDAVAPAISGLRRTVDRQAGRAARR